MKKIDFVKMDAAGNDFIVIDSRHSSFVVRDSLSELAHFICQRKTGVGADGLLVLERSKKADFKMRIFNADGSEAEMCGNGLRSAALYSHKNKKYIKIETRAGIYEAKITGKDRVKIKMEEPKGLGLNIPIKIHEREIKVNYIDTGVPHTVIFVQGLDKIDVESIGRSVRYHERFKPRGTNVDFVEIMDDRNINMRTYERGVEAETLACGTGAVAAAIVAERINVHTPGGVLKVYYKKTGTKIKDIYLEGEAKEVFRGTITLHLRQ